MKVIPSIGFNDFSGSAGNVTARKMGNKTYLSTKTKHSKKKTSYQATTRCRFSDTVRGYSKITEEQRQGWISLANNLDTYHTSTGKSSITGHNLFVAINSYRKICGKPKCEEAPAELRPSDYIRFNDFWLSPEHIAFTGIEKRENPNEVFYVEMYPAQSTAESSCWDKTVLVAICPTIDWGEIDLTRAFIEKFGAPLTIGQKVFIKICWLDSECGYIKNFTQIVKTVQEVSFVLNKPFIPRPKITLDQLSYNKENFLIERFDFELSPSPKFTSNEITILYDKGKVSNFGMDTLERMDVMDIGHSYQYARDSSAYHVILVELQILTSYNKRVEIYSRSSVQFQKRTELFGTYYLTY